MRAGILVTLVLAGCLEVPSDGRSAPMCQRTSDCNDAAGEVCEEGVCWGNPPAFPYAAVISPSTATRTGAATTEVTSVHISSDGWLDPLSLTPPTKLRGSVRLVCTVVKPCDAETSLPAEITLIRPSSIPGGPRYVRGTVSIGGLRDGSSFQLEVPPSKESDAPYEVIVVPQDDPTAPVNPATLAPPLRMELPNGSGDDLSISVGQGRLRLVKGKIVDGAGRGLPGMRVIALGRWDPARAVERVSTVAYTGGDGTFNLYLAGDALAVIGLVAQAPMGTLAPVLRKDDISASEAIVDVGVLRMPSHAVPARFRVPVFGYEPGGAGIPVAGATVTFRTVIDDGLETSKVEAVYEVTTMTDSKGQAVVDLIPGAVTAARIYDVRIITPPDLPIASAFDLKLSVGSEGGVLEAVELQQRVAITGTVYDANGAPVEGVTVTPSPSQSLRARIDDGTRVLLADVQPQAQVTDHNGQFVVFVDPLVGAEPMLFDLDCNPAAGARVPRWTVRDVALSPKAYSTSSDVFLPPAAFVRGTVLDPTGQTVGGAEVRIFSPGDAECANLRRCETPAGLVAYGSSDAEGIVRLVLPRQK